MNIEQINKNIKDINVILDKLNLPKENIKPLMSPVKKEITRDINEESMVDVSLMDLDGKYSSHNPNTVKDTKQKIDILSF